MLTFRVSFEIIVFNAGYRHPSVEVHAADRIDAVHKALDKLCENGGYDNAVERLTRLDVL